MYDPPKKDDVYYFMDSYKTAYDEGYNAAKDGKPENDNPYEESNHPRDTTYNDEMHYWWYVGYSHYFE